MSALSFVPNDYTVEYSGARRLPARVVVRGTESEVMRTVKRVVGCGAAARAVVTLLNGARVAVSTARDGSFIIDTEEGAGAYA